MYYTVYKQAVLSLIDELIRGNRKTVKRSDVQDLRKRILDMGVTTDPNWVRVQDQEPPGHRMMYVTCHNSVTTAWWDPSALCFKTVLDVPLRDVTAWYKEPRPYPYQRIGFKEAKKSVRVKTQT